MSDGPAAIVLSSVTKHFRKSSIRRDHTTLKTELVRIITGKRKLLAPSESIVALRGVDVTIPKGKTIGIIGRNGSGKSTLLKLMTGIYKPTTGTVTVNGRISALLDLGAGFHPDFTGRENILINGIILGMSRAEVKARTPEIIAFSELGEFIDEPVRTYSSGMFMRLAFAVATHVDPDILIVDEILAVGDEHFSRKSTARMNEFKQSGRTIVLVTHDLSTVQRWCDLAAWLDGGKVRAMGSPAEVIDQYRRAVDVAEQTGADALKAPGLELPAVAPPEPQQPALKLTELKVERVSAKVEVQVLFEVASPVSFELVVQISDSAGRVLFASTLPASVQATGQARARLSIEHLGFQAGEYTVLARAFPQAPAPMQELRAALQWSSSQSERSVPPSWTLEPPTLEKRSS
jgi:lipopolysaccharide transport system ATP-binding protein